MLHNCQLVNKAKREYLLYYKTYFNLYECYDFITRTKQKRWIVNQLFIYALDITSFDISDNQYCSYSAVYCIRPLEQSNEIKRRVNYILANSAWLHFSLF